jgi:hypothetical protein
MSGGRAKSIDRCVKKIGPVMDRPDALTIDQSYQQGNKRLE